MKTKMKFIYNLTDHLSFKHEPNCVFFYKLHINSISCFVCISKKNIELREKKLIFILVHISVRSLRLKCPSMKSIRIDIYRIIK